MPSTEEQVKSVILKHNGGARKQQIARELNLGLDYVDLVCRDMERKVEIIFSGGFYSLTKSRREPLPDKQRKFIQDRERESVLFAVPKMTKRLVGTLEKAGYKTLESLADAPITKLMQETNLELREAAGLINQARKALNKI